MLATASAIAALRALPCTPCARPSLPNRPLQATDARGATVAKPVPRLTPEQTARVVETAWDDRPPFHQVLLRHGLGAGELMRLMRRELTPSAFKLWSQRTR